MRKLWIVVGALAFLGLLVWMTMGMRKARVKVCMDYQGRRSCATAAAENVEAARRTATQTACGTIAQGMTASMQCQAMTPVTVDILE